MNRNQPPYSVARPRTYASLRCALRASAVSRLSLSTCLALSLMMVRGDAGGEGVSADAGLSISGYEFIEALPGAFAPEGWVSIFTQASVALELWEGTGGGSAAEAGPSIFDCSKNSVVTVTFLRVRWTLSLAPCGRPLFFGSWGAAAGDGGGACEGSGGASTGAAAAGGSSAIYFVAGFLQKRINKSQKLQKFNQSREQS